MAKASEAHRSGKRKQAERLYRKLVSARPDMGSAWNGLGTLLFENGNLEQAEYALKRAVGATQPYPRALYNLALIYHQQGLVKKAFKCLEQLLEKEPGFAQAWNFMGVIYKEQGEFEKAFECFEKALELLPGFAEAWNNKGTLFDALGKSDEAVSAYEKALSIQPNYVSALFNLAQAFHNSGKLSEASKYYQKVLALEPDHTQAAFLLKASSCDQKDIPEAPPIQYVKGLFDQCSDKFEEILVKELDYKTPGHLLSLALPYLGEGLAILDLGCGTGLAAPLLRPLASYLAGLDASQRMLVQAEKKGLYDELVQADILKEWGLKKKVFDFMFCADVLVYIGALESVFSNIKKYLRPRGMLAFSVEESNTSKYELRASGRYAHSENYIETCLSAGGFELLESKQSVLRYDQNKPVQGILFVARKME